MSSWYDMLHMCVCVCVKLAEIGSDESLKEINTAHSLEESLRIKCRKGALRTDSYSEIY